MNEQVDQWMEERLVYWAILGDIQMLNQSVAFISGRLAWLYGTLDQ